MFAKKLTVVMRKGVLLITDTRSVHISDCVAAVWIRDGETSITGVFTCFLVRKTGRKVQSAV